MRYVHPFPARMAPEIAVAAITRLREGSVVLDPMAGSGMVLLQAARTGLTSIGYDLDPLARVIAKVGASRVRTSRILDVAARIHKLCTDEGLYHHCLRWIDDDPETGTFIKFWFAPKQERQLRALSHYLFQETGPNSPSRALLQVAISRLIVTKTPKASLARDTAHSRPHRVILENEYDVLGEFLESVRYVLRAIEGYSIQRSTTVHLGDARRMSRIKSDSVDMIVTSPPYLNAIDYMRGHRLALVWFGHQLGTLRRKRSEAIGSEVASRVPNQDTSATIREHVDCSNLTPREVGVIARYRGDLQAQLRESYRVLKPGSTATYVIGNSRIREAEIRNNELLKASAVEAGFELEEELSREIPQNRRYLPVSMASPNTLNGRMKMEFIVRILKAPNVR